MGSSAVPIKPAEADDWVSVPAAAPLKQDATDSGDDFTSVPRDPKALPYNPNAPPAFAAPEGDPVTRFVKGFWSNTGAPIAAMGKTAWDLAQVAGGDKKELDPDTKQIVGNIIDAQHNEWTQAKQAWDQGNHVEAIGHSMAAAVPLIGPAAAHAGEAFSSTPPVLDKYSNVIQSGQSPDIARGLGESAGMLLPFGAQYGIEKLPNASRAGSALQQTEQVAGKVPVDVNGPGQVALDAQKLAQSGGRMPKVMSDFLRRATDPNQPPLTFSDARSFYSNATRLSANEFGTLTGPMLKRVTDFKAALNSSLQQAAEQAGVGDLYRAGLKEYSQAMGVRKMGQELKGVAQSSIGKGIGIGGASALSGWLYNKIWGKAEGGPILDRLPSRESVLASLKKRTGES